MNRKSLLLKKFSKKVPKTVNKVIDSIYKSDMKKGVDRDSWKFYVHLNKLPAQMEKEGLIQWTGVKENNEKLWLRT